MAAPSQPPARRVRSKSAKARLTTTKIDLDEGMLSHRPDFNKSKRAQSAMGNKTRSEASRFVLPAYKTEDKLGETHYEAEYEAKKGDLPDVRPSSPTRRNNPHPSDEFMQWKLASRVLESRQGTVKPQTKDTDVLSGVQERFYADYSGGNDGDIGACVPITNVATIAYPGRQKQRHPLQSRNPLDTAGVSGTRILLSQRKPSAAQKTQLVGAATKSDSTAELLKGWLEENAKDEESHVVMDMLKSAATDDVRLKKALYTTLSPAAIPGVEKWMSEASADERRTVTSVFEELAIKKRQTRAETSSSRMPMLPKASHTTSGRVGHTRRASDPLPVAQINPPPMLYRHAMQEFSRKRQQGMAGNRATSRALGSRPSSSMRRSHSHHGQDCNDCEASRMEGILSRLEIDNTRQQKREEMPPVTPMPAMLWHMYSKRDHTPNVLHRGAVFSMPQKYRGSHFELSPEWPTA